MSTIADRIETLRRELGEQVRLVAVSKFHPVEKLREAYDAGQRIFGENRVQEMVAKQPEMPDDVQWHLIGTLQRNKVKYIAPFVDTIESVDSAKLLREIERQAVIQERPAERGPIRCLLQIHISGEESKHGLDETELHELLESGLIDDCPHVEVVGLMAMASLTDDMELVERQFARMQELLGEVRDRYFADQSSFRELSIGMSQDYKIALRHGATYVRIGTAIFGPREY